MNKIHYGIENVYFAVVTETLGTNGQYTESYATPKRLIGARAISLSAQNENVQFSADNNPNYFTQQIFSGYDGTLTMATLSDDFRTEVLGETATNTDIITENINDEPKPFALLFQFEGDANATRHVMYRCTAGKPEIASTTKGTTIEPNEIAVPITAGGRMSDGKVKASCPETSTTEYDSWFTAVYTG